MVRMEVELENEAFNSFFDDQVHVRPTLGIDPSMLDGGFPIEHEDPTLKQMFALDVPGDHMPRRQSQTKRAKRTLTDQRKKQGRSKRTSPVRPSIVGFENPLKVDVTKIEPLSYHERLQFETSSDYSEEDFSELMNIVLDDSILIEPQRPPPVTLVKPVKQTKRKPRKRPSSTNTVSSTTISPRKTGPKGKPSKKRSIPGTTQSSKSQTKNRKSRVKVEPFRTERGQAQLNMSDNFLGYDLGEDFLKSLGPEVKAGCKRRRTKWLAEDTKTLWEGILKHGNNWSEIKNMLPGRTYYQVKDKGRRLLSHKGWRTGRSKDDACGAGAYAKSIARTMLEAASKDPSVNLDLTSVIKANKMKLAKMSRVNKPLTSVKLPSVPAKA